MLAENIKRIKEEKDIFEMVEVERVREIEL